MNANLKRKSNQNAPLSARDWLSVISGYRQPSDWRAMAELAVTFAPFATLWFLTWAALEYSFWLSLVLAVPAAGFLVRLFMIQHDCGHGAFFRSKEANDWTGRIIGVVTLTPYGFWRRAHAIHHASSGCLDRRGHGDINTLTVAEYNARSWWGRLQYRIYRNPLVMFGAGPIYLFFFQHRLPVGLMTSGWQAWASAMGTNVSIAVLAGAIIWFTGLNEFLMVHLPIAVFAGSAGVWLFFVQHQFEDTSWDKKDEWNWHDAALHGSSHYDLPWPLRWLTGNIGIHHVHHLCSRVPFYRLPAVLRDYPELRDVSRLTLLESLGCVRLVLWDEAKRRLVSFREARAIAC